jgi:RNA polymerase sigma factor (sigma-70 family)
LDEFARTRDEKSFRRVVDEFGGLVLSAAHRRTNDRELAEEVAQNVFAIMARKAKAIAKARSVAGWVFTTTRLEAAKALCGRQRRRRKVEALAEELTTTNDMKSEVPEQWRDALPYLEAGLDRLGDLERETLLARYFEEKSFQRIASETRTSEAACKMRVRRALDKLGTWIGRRGVTLSATAVTTGLTATWSQSTSAAVTASLSSKAIAAAPAMGTTTILTNSLHTMNAFKAAGVAAAAMFTLGAVVLTIQQG